MAVITVTKSKVKQFHEHIYYPLQEFPFILILDYRIVIQLLIVLYKQE